MKSGEPDRDALFLKIALEKNYISAEQADACREDRDKLAKMGYSRSLIQIATEKGFIDQGKILEIRREMQKRGVLPRIGGYELIAKIGQGGMGTVYKARQISLDRFVALKILSPELAIDKAYLERFRREGLMAAHITHPNAVQIIDVGESGGRHFMVMEYVEGPSADRFLSNGPLPERQALGIVRGALEALAVAHKSNIIHRDIKPANILINNEGRPKLADLGIARQSGVHGGTLTGTGASIGTPYYMSPEQCRGDKGIDGRADIYSLGATLYHLLTGKPPYFDSKTTIAIMYAQNYEPPPDPREINGSVSQGTSGLIRRMMAKSRDDRPPDCSAVIEEIDRLERGEVRRFVDIDSPPAPPAPTEIGSSSFVPITTPEGAIAALTKSRKFKLGVGFSMPALIVVAVLIALLSRGKGDDPLERMGAGTQENYETRLAQVEAARQSELLAGYETKWREMEDYERSEKWDDMLVALGELRVLGSQLVKRPDSFPMIESKMITARGMISSVATDDAEESESVEGLDMSASASAETVSDETTSVIPDGDAVETEYPIDVKDIVDYVAAERFDALEGKRFEFGGYTFELLGEGVTPRDINNRGEIVGSIRKAEKGTNTAFYFSPQSGFLDIGTLPAPFDISSSAVSINESGLAICQSNGPDNSVRVFVWSRERGMRAVQEIRGDRITVRGMNDSGRIIGTVSMAEGARHGFSCVPGLRMNDLGESYNPHAINNEGWIVGHGDGQAVIWGPDNQATYPGKLPDYEQGYGLDVNEAGVVVGYSMLRGQAMRDGRAIGTYLKRTPFVWTREEGMRALPVPDYYNSGIVRINNRGNILVSGNVRDPNARFDYMEKRRAGEVPEGEAVPVLREWISYLFTGDKRTELPNLIGNDYILYQAINDQGQMVGTIRIRVEKRQANIGFIASPPD